MITYTCCCCAQMFWGWLYRAHLYVQACVPEAAPLLQPKHSVLARQHWDKGSHSVCGGYLIFCSSSLCMCVYATVSVCVRACSPQHSTAQHHTQCS
jgi:hypothetical protein